MAKPRLSNAALEDLRSIRHYSKAVFGLSVARIYIDGLQATLNRLAERPNMGASERRLGEDMRSFGFRAHRIYFHADEGKVLIVRILHHAQDAPVILGEQ